MNWASLLLKAPPVKKKRMVQVKNALIDQELGKEIGTIQRQYTKWKSDCQGLSLADIGVTGKGHRDGAGSDTLLLHVQDHISSRVVRPNQTARRGGDRVVKLLDSLILDEQSILEEDDEKDILRLIKSLQDMSGGDEDPRNIPFTQPQDVAPVKGKMSDIGEEIVYGHYRTPIYVRSREKVHGSENEQSAVSSSWYSNDKNEAKPPFWQAIFAGADGISGGGKGDTIEKGLLAILQDFQKAMEGAFIKEIIINDKGDFANKVEALSKLPQLLKEIRKILGDRNSYRGGGHQLMYGGTRGITARLNNFTFKGQQKQTQRYLTSIAPYLKDISGIDDVKEFKIKFTDATVNRLINRFVRQDFIVPPHLGTNGKPLLLSAAGGGRKVTGFPWSSAYEQAVANSKIKKSWHDGLWG